VLIATAAFVFHLTEMPPAKPASTVSWQGGFFRYREIYPDGLRRWWLGNAGWREPTSSDRLPSIGVSLQPAIPRRVAPQQSPLPLHQSPTIIPQIPVRRGNQIARLNRTAGIQSRSPSSRPSPTGCHLYFARRVTFLPCANNGQIRRIARAVWGVWHHAITTIAFYTRAHSSHQRVRDCDLKELAMPDLDQIKQEEQGARDQRGRFARGRSGNPAGRAAAATASKPRCPAIARRRGRGA
jgi:hypothetical protein